jgi:DNA-directed RNA polymerase specialized sigma subunit
MRTLLRLAVEPLTTDEERELIAAAQDGDLQARNRIIMRHIPAMVTVAKEYRHKRGYPCYVETDDLVHVCVMGVIHAIRKFNPAKTTGTFLSYSRFWMRSYLNNAMLEYGLWHVPRSVTREYNRGKLTPATRLAVERYHEMAQLDTQGTDNQNT